MTTEAAAVGKTEAMPDPVRTVRVSDKLWNAVQDRAWELRDRSVIADYIRLALRAFVKDTEAAKAALRKIAGDDE